jgi:hypothetical protein
MPPTVKQYPTYTYAYSEPAWPDMDGLSDIRKKVINDLLPMVVPSTEDSPRFDLLMTHAKCDDQRKLNDNFTTCGSLPGWLFTRLGLNSSLSNYGLKGVMDAALALGCWVKNSDINAALYKDTYGGADLRPRPGDVYLLSAANNSKEIHHIGVIVNPTGLRWWTADAGQGDKPKQQAQWVPHKYIPEKRQLNGEYASWAKPPEPRRLVGWVDLDRAVEVS